jgi:hypothetical protein
VDAYAPLVEPDGPLQVVGCFDTADKMFMKTSADRLTNANAAIPEGGAIAVRREQGNPLEKHSYAKGVVSLTRLKSLGATDYGA